MFKKLVLSMLSLTSCLSAEIDIHATGRHTFAITAGEPSSQILWEVSDDPDFNGNSFAGTVENSSELDLQSVIPSLDPSASYFLRAQVETSDGWSQWSPVVAAARFPNYVPSSTWQKLAPYLMPDDHPLKAQLDAIFSKKKVLSSLKSLKKAGFDKAKPQPHTKVIVTKHPKMKGYTFKIYTNDQKKYKGLPEWNLWLKRATGAALVQAEIEKNNWQSLFKTPKKWIYALPAKKQKKTKAKERHFILVEEDMNLVSEEQNLALWKSPAVTASLLSAYFALLSNVGLFDCAKPKNAAFSHDGRIAFFDTQTYARWPVAYADLCPFLAPEMSNYWQQLINQQ